MPTVHLIDASPYIFRAYYSIPTKIVAPDGRTINAVYGYLDFLIQVVKREQPTHIAVAFDGSLTTSFRNEIYPEYKAQRDQPPEELKQQVVVCRDVTAAMGMASFIDDRFESDDLIGTLVTQLVAQGADCVIISSDKDFTQLVNTKVKLWDFARDEWYEPERVQAKFGVPPAQIVDLLALMGDSVDNIPGVKGVGPKAAGALLTEFGSIESIYQSLDEVECMQIRGAKSLRSKLEADREMAFISKELVTIATEAPLKKSMTELRYSGANEKMVESMFRELGFTGIRQRIPRWQK